MKRGGLFSDARMVRKDDEWEVWEGTFDVRKLRNPVRYAFLTAIGLVKKYRLPCDIEMRELRPRVLALHGWRKNGRCVIAISSHLTFHGNRRSVHRRIIHEIAHHIAGRGHGHDEVFKRIASDLYEREGYPRGSHGEGWGNI
jgi:hypothetical protein